MVKGDTHQENVNIVNVYTSNNIKQNLIKLKTKLDNVAITKGYVYTFSEHINRKSDTKSIKNRI